MSIVSLSDKQKTLAIVPVRCGSQRGTAFLVGGGKLLTARHVVDEYHNGGKPVVASFDGKEMIFRPENVGTDKERIDVVVLTCTEPAFSLTPLAQEHYLRLMVIPFEHAQGRKLVVMGYPTELGSGSCLIETTVRPHSEVKNKYDVVTVREGNFQLQNYGGFSGSPVLTQNGYVVGVVSTETFGKLTYCSVGRMAKKLKAQGVEDLDSPWEVYEDSNLSLEHCRKQVEESKKRASGRYHEEEHTPNSQLEGLIEDFANFKKKESIEKRLNALVKMAEEQLQDAKNAGYTPDPLPPDISETYQGNGFEGLTDYLEKLRRTIKPKTIYSRTLKRVTTSSVKLLEKQEHLQKQFMCLHGNAGTGKTQLSCHLAHKMVREQKNNVYLLFGSSFDAAEDAWDRILGKLHLTEDDMRDMEHRAEQNGHYAIFIIDALNEGAGNVFWKQQLNLLIGKLNDYPHLKLIFTIRDPFADEITEGIDPKMLESIELKGFPQRRIPEAIDKYFAKYHVDPKYKSQYKRQFQKPLILVVFCEAYWLMSQQERDNLTLRKLYATYLKSRNALVSALAEEDEKRNVTLTCMRELARHSVENCLSGLIPREDARKIADRICPLRTWRNNLLRALLYENLLMETLSDRTEEDMVMFEFENIADVMKAESLLMSKLTEQQIIDLLQKTYDELEKRSLSKSKFENMVRALIALWDRDTAVTDITLFTTGTFSFQLVKAREEYQGERNFKMIDNWLKKNKEQYNPRDMLHQLDDKRTTLFDTLHPYLRSLRMNERDEIWTTMVNQLIESPKSWNYIEMQCRNEQFWNRMTVLLPWMLTSSDPDGRMFLIRLLYRRLTEHPEDAETLMGLFERCNDHYVLQGLYCAIYGMMLRNRDGKLQAAIAESVYRRYYENDEDVPVDIVLRQWTLKILERASYIEPSANYFYRIRLPFKSQHPEERMLKKDFEESYFGPGKGASLLYYSMKESSDFHRYVIGSNSSRDSREFFKQDEEGEYQPVSLFDIPRMMAPLIRNDYKYTTELSHYDGSRFSPDRHHNKTERIGKKYQWLALDAVYAKMTDHYWVKDQRSDRWGTGVNEENLTREAWPWMTRRYDRFDPTMPSNEEIGQYSETLRLVAEKDDVVYAPVKDFKEWVWSEATHPVVRMIWLNSDGQEWVRIYGFESGKNTEGKERRETMLYYNSSFVKTSDSRKMRMWASERDFTGRWMPERTDCIDFLWNEMPWSDSYKRLGRDQWEESDEWRQMPCKVLVAYDEQLQEENYGFLSQEERYSYSASMPCGEMMREMKLYTAERGVVRKVSDDSVVAINMGIIKEGTGLVVRKDVLCEFMRRKRYHLFTYILGNKQVVAGNMAALESQDLSGCMMMDEDGEVKEVQRLRIVARKTGK